MDPSLHSHKQTIVNWKYVALALGLYLQIKPGAGYIAFALGPSLHTYKQAIVTEKEENAGK